MVAGTDEARARRLAAAVAVFALALFAVVLGNGFALDDPYLVVRNPYLHSLANIPRFFTSDYWEPTIRSGLYRPLVTTSYALNRALGGVDPGGYHALNALLHAANAALALLVLQRLTGRLALATLAAFLFAAHAVHAEVLANVSLGRPELLATLFFLLALRSYRPAGPVSAASLLWFTLGLLSKESAATLVAVLPLVDAVYGRGAAPGVRGALAVWRRRIPVYGIYALLALGYLGLRFLALKGGGVLPLERELDNPLTALPAGWRIASALWVAFHYAWLLLFPLHLAYDYSLDQIPLIRSAADPRLLLVAAGWTLAAGGLVACARRGRDAFFGILFTLATFSVVSNVAGPIGTILGERLLYLPSLGFCLALAAGLAALAGRLAPSPHARLRALAVLGALAVGLHGGRAVVRCLDWRSENGLYVHDLAVNPRSAKIQANAGAALAELGRHEEALRAFAAASEIAPFFAAPYQGTVLSLVALGRFEEAQQAYREALLHGPPNPEVEEQIARGLRERR